MTKPISHRFQLALSCAGGFLLVLASASYAADAPPDAAVNPTPEAAVSPQPEAVPAAAPIHLKLRQSHQPIQG